ncbi:unnamed protein product [Caenorhabditis angaria]|uniref:FYVE-type domain-containing protein n=1 Tax=Caenorhabditis angaria TaxID=860376 RepID=A0A9P1I2E1_9PELO|nr:unnamed protein product [Caenorhabditis angaria]
MSSWEEVNDSLKTLTVAEQNAIRSVLEKDLEFQQLEQNRIRSLSTSVQIKKLSIGGSESSESGLSSPGNISQGRTSPLPKWNTRSCSVCSATLGYILNSGTKCKKCGIALCEKCAMVVNPANKQQKHSLCPICFDERELSAAKNEWVQGSDEMTSEKLLSAMKTSDKRMSVQICSPNMPRGGRAPYKRNLTLPAIQTNFLSIPDEAQGAQQPQNMNISPKFWGGSPSPRSPRSIVSSGNSSMVSVYDATPGSDSLRAIHPREPIGSPAPRPMSSTPLCGVPENETTNDMTPLPNVERRRSAFEGSRRKFLEAILQFDRRLMIFIVHVLTVRTEKEPINDEISWVEVEFRQKTSKTIMRHKSVKWRSKSFEPILCQKINEIFKYPRVSENFLNEAYLKFTCYVEYENDAKSVYEGSIILKDLIGKKNDAKTFKFVELNRMQIYSIEEEEPDISADEYDWIISC